MNSNEFKPITDKVLIYLDQNVLSDLRGRIIEKEGNEKLKKLKKLLTSKDNKLQVVYSESNFIEIDRIKKKDYKDEHIELLEELNALYIHEPESKEKFGIYIDPKLSPTEAWLDYIKRNSLNKDSDLLEYYNIYDLQSRKLFGLIKEPTFQELFNRLCNKCDLLFLEKTDVLSKRMRKNYENLKLNLQKQIGKDDEVLLNINFLREKINKSLPNLSKLPLDQIIPEILKALNMTTFFVDPNSFYFRHEILNKVVDGYKLLNISGYYPDDFTKHKKNTDRYAASFGDNYHLSNAIGVDFLISNDERFRRKAEVCYSYVGVKTQVCSIDEFFKIITPINKLAFAIHSILFSPKK